MSQSGQQHPKADVGGQRTEQKKADHKKPSDGGDARQAVVAGKESAAKSDAKK